MTRRKPGQTGWPAAGAALATVALLALGGCAAGGGSLCEAAGGRYAAGTCVRSWTPAQEAAQERCQSNGGVYLGGTDSCAVGASGP